MILPALLSLSMLQAQDKGKTPAPVVAAFKKAFPNAQQVRYGKEDNNFEVDFAEGGKKKSAVFTPTGQLVETETVITALELPAAVMPYFQSHYKGVKIHETARIVNAKGLVTYEVGIKGKDILFDANGKFLKEAED